MQAGFSRINITPYIGMDMGGYMQIRKSTGINDELYSAALVLENNNIYTAIVGVDVLAISTESVENIRTMVEKETSISRENIMISASHTHTGPSTVEIFNSKPDYDWLKIFEKQVASSIINAYNNLQPSVLKVGIGKEDSFMFNRRLLGPDNKVEMTLDQDLTNNSLYPEGSIDPSVNVLSVKDLEDNYIALLVNYSNHLDIPTGSKYSADYPAYMTKTVKKILGEDVGVVFVNGACGDVEHLNPFDPEDIKTRERYLDSKGLEKTIRYGTILGCEVVRTSLISKTILDSSTPIKVKSKEINIPVREVPKAQVEWAKQVKNNPDDYSYRDKTQANEFLEVYKLAGTDVKLEIQVISIGDIVYVGIPAEVFVDIGLKIKKQSPKSFTFICELANGWVGYLPTETAFENGGHETIIARFSKLSPNAESIVVETALELINSIM